MLITKILKLFPKQFRKRTVYLAFSMMISAVLEVAGIASILPFMALMTDRSLIKSEPLLIKVYSFLNFSNENYFLLFIGCVVLALLLLSNLIAAFSAWLIMRFSSIMGHVLSTRMLRMYLQKPYVFYLTRNSSDMAAVIFTEINQIVSGILLPSLQIVSRIFLAVIVLGCLFLSDVVLASSVFAVTGSMYTMIYFFVKNRLAKIGDRRVTVNKLRFNVASEAFGGIKDLKVLNREIEYIQRFSKPSREFADYNAESQAIATLPKYLMESIAFGGVLVVSLYTLYLNQSIASILPTLTFYAFAGYRLMPALQMIFTNVATIRYNSSAIDSFIHDVELIDQQVLVAEKSQSAQLMQINRSLEVRDVSFSYSETDRSVLSHVSLIIPANTTVAFVGATGSGKTTLIDVILGLLVPNSGKILIDGNVLTQDALPRWQKNIGYVSQTIFLADDTIAQNIAFGIPKEQINMGAVIRAAQLARLHDFIEHDLPEKYETMVGERGIRLSGGQRQRIGIARALYMDPQVLIFDEATSALDNLTELAIMEAISSLSHKKTIIMIAHRLTTVRSCDEIFVLDRGVLVARGGYDELLRGSDFFRTLSVASGG